MLLYGLLKKQQIAVADKPFADGGEGEIHNLTSDPLSVAKIYYPDRRTSERFEKLKAMIQNPPHSSAKGQVAWPTEILLDSNKAFVGFIMPKVKNVIEIAEIYSYDKRNSYPYTFFVQVAQNLCVAVNAVHSGGHVCGYLNPANVCVSPQTALVTLVDTDSYHIKASSNTIYRCPVYMAEYVPREILALLNTGEDLKSTKYPTFSVHTDSFAVAVHVFALLMNGTHPFACTPNDRYSGEHFRIKDNISNGVFAYLRGENRVKPPLYAPALDSLPKPLLNVLVGMLTASKAVDRPTLSQLYTELEKFEAQLVQCQTNANHFYHKQNKSCPFCKCERVMQVVKTTQALKKSTSSIGGSTAIRTPAFGKQTAWIPPKSTGTVTTAPKAAATPAPRSNSAATATRPSVSSGSSGGGFLSMIFAFLFALIFWAAVQAGAAYGLYRIPLDSWWWSILRYASFGIVAYLPLLIFIIIDSAAILNDFFEMVAGILALCSFPFALLAYGGLAVWGTWDTGLFNISINVVLICLPVILVRKVFSGI